MHCIEQPTTEERVKYLTPSIRNEIVRDVVAQMFAFEQKPKKFATKVAQQLAKKILFPERHRKERVWICKQATLLCTLNLTA